MLRAFLALLLLAPAPPAPLPTVPPGLADVFAAPAEMRLRGIAQFADGLVVTSGNELVFSDVIAGRTYTVDPNGGVRSWTPDKHAGEPDERRTGRARGAFDAIWEADRGRNELGRASGDVFLEMGGISAQPGNGPAHVAVLVEGPTQHPKDATAERVVWTEPAHHPADADADADAGAAARKGGVYEFRRTLKPAVPEAASPARLISDAMQDPMGLTFSPDRQLLYVSDAATGSLHAIALGKAAESRSFVAPVGSPARALATDEAGRIYCATPGGIAVLRADGAWLGAIPLPEASNDLAWGGPDRRTLWIATVTGLWRIETKTAGAFPR